MKITPTARIPEGTTVGELANGIYPDITFDHSLPQPWLDAVTKETGTYLAGQVVWGYPKGHTTFGYPLPLTVEAADIIADYMSDPPDIWVDIVTSRMDRGA